MSRPCANPACGNTVGIIGVCVSCADSNYEPTKHGVGYAGVVTGDGFPNWGATHPDA